MMSKTWLIAAAWLLTSVAASAQEPEAWRPKYVNLSFVSQKLDFGEGEKLKSRFGAAFTTGRSYYLHKKPVAGMIRFGIDATWIDLSYANYSRDRLWALGRILLLCDSAIDTFESMENREKSLYRAQVAACRTCRLRAAELLPPCRRP